MVANFGMTAINSAVDLPIQNQACANPCPDGDVEKPRSRLSGSPPEFTERCGIGVVFERRRNAKLPR